MHELGVLKPREEKDADAIAAPFTPPDRCTIAHPVVDAGWQVDGETLVRHQGTFAVAPNIGSRSPSGSAVR
jgi:hypothetical protein